MKNYPMVKLGDDFILQMGKTPSRSNVDYWHGDISWVSIADIGSAKKFISNTKERISKKAINETGIKIVPQNTLIMSFKLSIGKTAITAKPIYTNEAIMAFIPKREQEYDISYLYHLFSNKDWSIGSNNAVMGTTLNKTTLSITKIPKPPLSIQKEISLCLDKIENLISKCKEQLSKLDKLAKSRFIEMFGDVIRNDKNWKVKKWKDVLEIKNGKSQKDVIDEKGKYPIYGSGGIIGYASNYITKANSIVIGRKGSINKPFIVKENFWNVDTAFGIEPDNRNINLHYLFLFCNFFDFKRLNKAAVLPSLVKSDLLNIQMPIPPFSIQEDFSIFIEQLDKSKFRMKKCLKMMSFIRHL